MKVYIIEMGCYSDRHVFAVSSTQEKAEGILNLARNYKHDDTPRHDSQPVLKYELEDADITEYELDKIPVFLQQRIYEVDYSPNRPPQNQWFCQLRKHEKDYWPPYTIRIEGKPEPYVYSIAVPAKDKEAALKIANEHIMQYLARRQETIKQAFGTNVKGIK